MIGHKRFPSREGGVEVAVEALATRMAAQGHDVTLYNRGRNPDDTKNIYQGVHIRSVPVIEKSGIAAVMGSVFATLHAIFCHYDCIHYHAEGPAAMCWLPKFLGIRTIVTIHGLDWQRSKWGRFASLYLHLGEKIAARWADEVIVLSRAMKQYFLDTYSRETVFIPNGMEHPEILPPSLIRTQWGLEKDQYILYLGRLVPEKGVQYLIDAFRLIKTDKKLVIAGKADSVEFGQQLKEAALGDDRIRFIGFVQGQAPEELYSNCYLYCLPSELEGMPISLLEAMGYGCCCLSSDIPECAEVIGSCGYLFENRSAESLRKVLQTLCGEPELVTACRTRVQQQVQTCPGWDQVAGQTLALYRRKQG